MLHCQRGHEHSETGMNGGNLTKQALDLLGTGHELVRMAGALFDATSDGIMITDAEGMIVTVNAAFSHITGYSLEEVIGHKASLLRSGKHSRKFYEDFWATLTRDGHWEGEVWNKRKSGELYPQSMTITAIREGNEPIHYLAMMEDISQRKLTEEQLTNQANYDALTGLPSRTLFVDRLGQAIVTARRGDARIAVLFVNLDGFKLVNDTLGHARGDILLKEAASRLLECVRDNDTVARVGGDEFTLLLINPSGAMSTTIVAQRIVDNLATAFDLTGKEAFISGSIGIAFFPDDGAEPESLIKNADAAMGQAKRESKASYKFFTQNMNVEAEERLNLKNGLAKAMERKEFRLYYQAKMDIASGHITCAEALIRWDSRDLGWVSPVRFIPILEDAGLIREVGDWVIDTACKQHAVLRDAGFPGIRLAVNLSARQLHDPSITESVRTKLENAGIGPEGLELEITESMLMTDPDRTASILRSFKDMGLHLAMDDFGTGYSSLSYLKRFPIDTIKIDRAFIKDITENKDDAEICRAIINMGRALDRVIVAEGVETDAHLDILTEARCHYAQGFLISKPVPADDFLDFLRRCKGGKKAWKEGTP